jgi:predicted amidophosphoribosyltransferase
MTTPAAPIKSWLNTGLGFFYPEICRLCETERATAADGFVCSHCWSHVRFIKPPFCERCGLPFEGDFTTTFECTNCREMELHFSSARSAVVAKTVVLEAIHRFKYQNATWFENFLADLFLREAVPALRGQKWDFIAPVPLHPLKKREREFNQAENLARHLSAATKIPLNTKSATACHTHADSDPADARGAREKYARRVCRPRRRVPDRRAGDSRGRRVHDRRDDERVCAGVARGRGGDVCVWTVARGL